VGRACSTYDRGEKSAQGFGGKGRRKQDNSEDQGVDGRLE
jgi:hypothetical protein